MDNHLITAVRQNHPITFTVANTVTSGKVADALSAIGAYQLCRQHQKRLPTW